VKEDSNIPSLRLWARRRLAQYRQNRERGIISGFLDEDPELRAAFDLPGAEPSFDSQLTVQDLIYLHNCRIRL